MKTLLLIRHGLPDEGNRQRLGDPPLNTQGRRQAFRLGRRLASCGVDRIVCSPQQRAIDTAAPLARLTGLTPEIHEGLAEVDYGIDRYRSPQTLQREEPHRWQDFVRDPAGFFGKDAAVYKAGVLQCFESILANALGTRIAVFSHGMTIKTLLYAVLGVEHRSYSHLTIDHCSTSRIAGDGLDAMRIESVNESLGPPRSRAARARGPHSQTKPKEIR